MSDRLAFRRTSFNIPSNRHLWHSLGEFDSLVEYQEVANRLMLDAYDPNKETFRDYLMKASQATGVYLNDITLDNYREIQYQGYLIFPNASFDEFLTGFVEDVKILVDIQFAESRVEGCRFEKILDALNNIGINTNINAEKIKLYHYYRFLRNDVAHRINKDFDAQYTAINLNAIHTYYPTLAIPQPKNSLNFDDFILCTANIKSIADEMTISLLPRIDWVNLVLANIDKWLPKYKRFLRERRLDRLKSAINQMISIRYGLKLSSCEIENIVGSLE